MATTNASATSVRTNESTIHTQSSRVHLIIVKPESRMYNKMAYKVGGLVVIEEHV